MATIYIDNQPEQANPKQNLLHACLSLGYDLPYFCWHPALGSVGACRQCAVKQFRNEQDTTGKLIMACMTPAAEGTRISIADPDAVAFRGGGDSGPDAEPSARLPGLRRRRRVSSAGHDRDDRSPLAHLQLRQTNVPQSVSRPAGESRDEPLHSVPALRALLSRIRRRR